ncbi:universal stress protein [Dactylosporangium sp. NPDC005555]|uniref:universal stress protein n=1 Tax=Dactylosporangium sp. NPDC005555 TaxID=3154889 RepID=UPI0033A570EC
MVAVRAIERPIGPPAVGLPPLLYDTAETHRALAEAATAHVAAAGQRHPKVSWEFHGIAGDAADVLCDRSRRARLVVVSNRGHGGFTGLLLGSRTRADSFGFRCCSCRLSFERPASRGSGRVGRSRPPGCSRS